MGWGGVPRASLFWASPSITVTVPLPAPRPCPQVCPETNQVLINIGLLLLAFPSPTEEGQLR